MSMPVDNALTKNLTTKQMDDMIAESQMLRDKEDEQNFASVLEVMWKINRQKLEKKGAVTMVYEAFLEIFADQINETVEQKVEKTKEEERIISIWTVLENGGTDELAKKYLNATSEELEKAHQYR